MAGIVQACTPRAAAFPRRTTAESGPQPGCEPRVSLIHALDRRNEPDAPRLGAPGAACLLAALVAAVAPGAADSAPLRVVVLGQTAETPPASCPGKIVNNVEVKPCRVEGHVTGFQSIAGGIARPYEAPFDGKVVAWSITLAKPSTTETDTTTDEVGFFDEFLGEPSEARIGILRPVEGSKPPKYTLVRQSPLEVLNPYFGTTPIFALEHPLTVLKGQVVALTVPTWAPMFAFNVATEQHLARQPPAGTLRLQGRHPGRPPPAGRRQDQDLRLLLLERAAALHRDAGQETVGLGEVGVGYTSSLDRLAGSARAVRAGLLASRRKTFGGTGAPRTPTAESEAQAGSATALTARSSRHLSVEGGVLVGRRTSCAAGQALGRPSDPPVRRGGPSPLRGSKRAASTAVGAVADVEADQLVAAAAGPEVLGGARQGRTEGAGGRTIATGYISSPVSRST